METPINEIELHVANTRSPCSMVHNLLAGNDDVITSSNASIFSLGSSLVDIFIRDYDDVEEYETVTAQIGILILKKICNDDHLVTTDEIVDFISVIATAIAEQIEQQVILYTVGAIIDTMVAYETLDLNSSVAESYTMTLEAGSSALQSIVSFGPDLEEPVQVQDVVHIVDVVYIQSDVVFKPTIKESDLGDQVQVLVADFIIVTIDITVGKFINNSQQKNQKYSF